jgi:hypothetical protein
MRLNSQDESVERDEMLCAIDDEEGNEDNLEEDDEIEEG